MKKRRKKIKYVNILIIIMFIISLITFIYSVISIINWKKDNSNTNENIEKINEIVDIQEYDVEIEEQEEVQEETEETEEAEVQEEEPNQYKDLNKINIMSVNFTELLKTNSDTKGWLKVSGTKINYPFVQTTDNDFYLTHAFDKTKNNAGWLFLDYRNNSNLQDKNNIIYAHNRADLTMFGTLKYTSKSWWYTNEDYYNIKLSTPEYNTVWKVFSTYTINNTNDYIKTKFNTDSEYQEFIDMLINRSKYNYNVEVTTNDRILTLSTCFGSNQKTVLHAKLITEKKR